MSMISRNNSSSSLYNYNRECSDWRDFDVKIPKLCLKGSSTNYEIKKNPNATSGSFYPSMSYDISGLMMTTSSNVSSRDTSWIDSKTPPNSESVSLEKLEKEINAASAENSSKPRFSEKYGNLIKRTTSSISFKSPEVTSNEKALAEFASTRTTDFSSNIKTKQMEDYMDQANNRIILKECCQPQTMINQNNGKISSLDFFKKDQNLKSASNFFSKTNKTKFLSPAGTSSNKENYIISKEKFLAENQKKKKCAILQEAIADIDGILKKFQN